MIRVMKSSDLAQCGMIYAKAFSTDPIKNYVLTTIDGQDLPHFAGFCHLARFSVK